MLLSNMSFGPAATTTQSAAPPPNTVQLPLTLVGTTSTRAFTVRNTGTLAAHVCLSILSEGDDNDGLIVERREEDVTIMPDSQEEFRITYTPTRVGKSTIRLRATLRHNPFENKELNIEAESFAQAISFENIEPAYPDLLNLGSCYPNVEKTYTFDMRNNSAHNVRYEWQADTTNTCSVEFVPRMGHLGPGAARPVTVHLTRGDANAARHVAQTTVQVQSVELMSEAQWDSTMVDQKWIVVNDGPDRQLYGSTGRRNLKKVMEPVAEPPYRVLEHLSVAQRLLLAYTCDSPTYELSLVDTENEGRVVAQFESIAFPTTKMFQRRVVTLRVKNTGTVALPYEMIVEAAAGSSGVAESPRTAGASPDAEGAIESGTLREGSFLPVGSDFEVEPDTAGSIAVDAEKDFSIVFSPHASGPAAPMSLLCYFPHVAELAQRRVPLLGSGECPLVHVQVPPSAYLSLRIDGEAGPSVNPDSTVLEFLTRGLHTQVATRFQVYNPTASPYNFLWSDKSLSESLSPFQCLTPSGTVAAGRSVEMAFEFIGETLGVREREWSLSIVGKDVTIPFLLVGRTVDPHVFFNSTKIQFGNVNLGGKVEKIIWLENRDDVPSTFTFNKGDLKVMNSFLGVRPGQRHGGAQGEAAHHDQLCAAGRDGVQHPARVPGEEGEHAADAQREGRRRLRARELVLEPSKGHPNPIPVLKDQILTVNPGRVQVDERVTRTFILSNDGQSAFDYSVTAPERRYVTIEGATGSVAAMSRAVITLSYSPTAEERLRQFRMQFRIGGKLSYQVGVQASTYVPKLQLSFERYDFGPRFVGGFTMTSVAGGGSSEISTVLSIVNLDKEDVNVECGMSEGTEWCTLSHTNFVAKSNGTNEVRITFHPDDVRVYTDKLRLLLNGAYPVFVSITGEGVHPHVEIVNRFAKFGVVRVGERRDVELRLKCASRIPTPISFMGCLPEDLLKRGVSIGLVQLSTVLKPREVRNITLSFKPPKRMGEFQREVKMLVCGREQPFAMISGACEDAETRLDTNMLVFSDVVMGSSVTRRVMIMNTGDIAQKFSWRHIPSTGELTVNPVSGFIQAHTDLACDFVYRPSSAASAVNQKVMLELECAPPLTLHVEAGGMSRPPPKETVHFNCRARQVDTQRVVLENPSAQSWTFTPVVDNSLWSAPSSITIKPKAKGEVELQYAPMRETKKEKDVGTLFIAQQEGCGITYQLEGTAEAAGPSAPVREIDLVTNAAQTVNFPVSNWSSTPTNFTRVIEWTSPPNLDPGLITVKGSASIDVPAQSAGENSVSFQCMKEGQYRGVVRFNCNSNPDLNQYYELQLKVATVVASAAVAAVMEVRGPARVRTTANIPIGNPLSKPLHVTCKLDGPPESLGSLVVPSSIMVPPKNAVNLGIEFMPLVHRAYAPVKVLLTCPDLDASTYTLNLQSTPAPAERLTRITCPLGQQTHFTLTFTHHTKTATEFAIKVIGDAAGASMSTATKGSPVPSLSRAPNQSATVKATPITNARGQELSAEFIFEPRALGVTKDVIEFVSPLGGTFTFPILTTCVAPQPLGPFQLHSGQNLQLPFRNVFTETLVVQVTSDSPFFTVGKKTENIAAKKVVNIAVQCKMGDAKEEQVPEMVFGKLMISSTIPGEKTPVEWIYYLEGTRDAKKK
ncbi:hypothetical protein STCU_09291 [Strigomonas culicis]|uniref:Abnormal spindle-like microcephaly-associated protein ASH domain-containing protein n=1 Tax=Strigomonas culicis TaxID=28005 RepID=S9TTE2_9TRYP|nr:hypothetical protein STCU_09291 [Strigomonas culicis]|eukprot:EPY19798.1 hypothetical protein STCU_09291 [Strigomonas culicis]